MRQKIKLRNPFARVLASRLYRRRLINAKKGKGSYKRRPKHSQGRRFLVGIGLARQRGQLSRNLIQSYAPKSAGLGVKAEQVTLLFPGMG